LRRDQIPGATTINNIAMRVGNSFGVAIAAVLLQRRIADSIHNGTVAALAKLTAAQRSTDALALSGAFRAVFWYSVVLVVVAIVPASMLPRRREIATLHGPNERPEDASISTELETNLDSDGVA
jgi:ABC-type dipeptide/oligopeptide/nickel transport system permease component